MKEIRYRKAPQEIESDFQGKSRILLKLSLLFHSWSLENDNIFQPAVTAAVFTSTDIVKQFSSNVIIVIINCTTQYHSAGSFSLLFALN